MIVRTFRGKQMNEMLGIIRSEIGEDAVIISSKHLPNDVIELEVGIDEGGLAWDNSSGSQVINQGSEFPEVFDSSTNRKTSLSRILANQGVLPQLSRELLKYPSLEEGLAFNFNVVPELPAHSKIVALIGPTGVGKTTTIAKLAARIREAFGLKIGLISADSYRVGAGFHLQTYASLLRMPFQSVDTREEVGSQLKRMVDSFGAAIDLVLIDTPGCGIRDKNRLRELSSDLNAVPGLERILVLQAPGNDRDLNAIAGTFGSLIGFSRIIITKLDESGFIGPVLNTVYKHESTISFFTTGQRVPEDIEPASFRRLEWMLARTIH